MPIRPLASTAVLVVLALMSVSPANRTARRGQVLPAYPRPRASTPPSALLTTREAMAYLRISKTTLRHYVADGLLHPIRLGPKNLRWDPADLDSVLR